MGPPTPKANNYHPITYSGEEKIADTGKSPEIERLARHRVLLDAHKRTLAAAEDVAKINTFIIDLCENPSRVADFKRDPDSVMAAAGIDEPLRDLIKAGHRYTLIRGRVPGADFEAAAVVVVVVVVVVV